MTDVRPLPSFSIIALNLLDGGEAIEATHHKQAALHNFDAKVTARVQHGGQRVPGVGVGVVGLSSAQTGGSTETSNLLEKR